jgi:glycosyltransferase involved in cell wall biosynthesis
MCETSYRMDPKQITIAITVYNRRQYLKQAISSALAQTIPVRVMVVEDCGPDPSLQSFVKSEFGARIEYVRNPKRRGLFGNWNACLELCQTEWITILHDDDFLAPEFIEAIIELETEAPGCALYLGRTLVVNERGEPAPEQDSRTVPGRWMKRELMDILYLPFWFAGHLFRVSDATAVGGFRATSFMCGDREMWANLIALGGAAQSSRVVAFNRGHEGWDRGSIQAARSGRHIPTTIAQHKRILALMPRSKALKFDRIGWQRRSPMSTRFLLRYGGTLSPRLLRYHVRLLLLSPAPHWRYAVFQHLTRMFGPGFVRCASALWNRRSMPKKEQP